MDPFINKFAHLFIGRIKEYVNLIVRNTKLPIGASRYFYKQLDFLWFSSYD